LQRAARLANGLQPLAARVRHAAHHTPATGCALLQRTALRCKRCNRLQQSAVGCNRRHCVATGCNRLVRCSGPHCVAIIAATGCNGLWSVATGRGLLQPAVVCCQRTALCCHHRCNWLQRWSIATGRGLWQRAAVDCKCLWSVAATDCTALQSLQQVARRCGPWQRTVVCCNRLCCVASGRIADAHAEQRCNRLQRAVVGCNRLRRVATRAALQQVRLRHARLRRVATGCCVVVRSAFATRMRHCNGWATLSVASSHKPC
jgi:hypothetical protein